jgi:DNA-binding GntR family transcriptional regulator
VNRIESDGARPGVPSPAAATGLAEHVYQLLKAEVINNEFEADERIVIETVALRLGVSPTPVREALARLAGEQLV